MSVGRSPSRVRHVATPNTATSQVAGSPDHEKRSVGCRRRRPSSRDVVSASVYIVRVYIAALVVPEIKAGEKISGTHRRTLFRCDLAAVEEKKK